MAVNTVVDTGVEPKGVLIIDTQPQLVQGVFDRAGVPVGAVVESVDGLCDITEAEAQSFGLITLDGPLPAMPDAKEDNFGFLDVLDALRSGHSLTQDAWASLSALPITPVAGLPKTRLDIGRAIEARSLTAFAIPEDIRDQPQAGKAEIARRTANALRQLRGDRI